MRDFFELLNLSRKPKPLRMTPSQMAATEVVKGMQSTPSLQTLGGMENEPKGIQMTAPVGYEDPQAQVKPHSGMSRTMRPMLTDMLGGMSNTMNGLMDDARRSTAIAPQPIMGYRYGGTMYPGDEGVVAEDTDQPEHVKVHPDGRVEITPLASPPRTLAQPIDLGYYPNGVKKQAMDERLPSGQTMRDLAEEILNGQSASPLPPTNPSQVPLQTGAKEAAPAFWQVPPPATEGRVGGRVMEGETGTITPPVSGEAGLDPTAPRNSPLETKRIIARDTYDSGSEDVWKAREDVLKDDIWKAQNEPQSGSFWKSLGVGLMQIAKNRITKQEEPVVGWRDYKRNEKLKDLVPKYKAAQAVRLEKEAARDRELKRQAVEAEIENKNADNIRQQEIARGRVIDQIKRRGVFNPADPMDAEQARLAGLDPNELKGFDIRKTDTKTIGGRVYQVKDGVFKPVDVPENELEEYTVEMPQPDGTTAMKTFKVPRADAIKFAQQLKVMGLQLQQRTTEFNATKDLETQKTNISNRLKYQDDMRAHVNSVMTANKAFFDGNAEAANAARDMQSAAEEATAAAQAEDQEAFDKAQKKFQAAETRAKNALTQSEAGAAALQAWERNKPQMAPEVKFTPIKPATGKPVPKAKDPAGIFQ